MLAALVSTGVMLTWQALQHVKSGRVSVKGIPRLDKPTPTPVPQMDLHANSILIRQIADTVSQFGDGESPNEKRYGV